MTLAARNLPSGVTMSFTSNSLAIQSGRNSSSNVMISVDVNATLGTSQIAIEGSDANLAHEVGLIITITNSSTTAPYRVETACFIATATYGSEVSPEVQILRNFRDNSLAKTRTGSSFLIIFKMRGTTPSAHT